jgi:hypothetical protein
MGDRANIVLNYGENKPKIYLYTHSCGTELPVILAKALNRGRHCWNSKSYLARVIFSEMIKNEILENDGYGISPHPINTDKKDIEVDMENQIIHFSARPFSSVLSYDEFIKKNLKSADETLPKV